MAETTEENVRLLLEPTDAKDSFIEEVSLLDPNKAVPILNKVLLDSQETKLHREMAALILGMLGDESAIPALNQTLSAPDPVLRAVSARAIGRIGTASGDVVAQLIGALKDEDYFVRKTAAQSLGELKSQEALPALAHMTSVDTAITNREVAEEAIKTIKGLA